MSAKASCSRCEIPGWTAEIKDELDRNQVVAYDPGREKNGYTLVIGAYVQTPWQQGYIIDFKKDKDGRLVRVHVYADEVRQFKNGERCAMRAILKTYLKHFDEPLDRSELYASNLGPHLSEAQELCRE